MFCSKSLYAFCWFLSDNVVEILTSIIAMLLTTNVNAALTIQLFSQMFHFINVWLFNRLVRDRQLCTREWGRKLRHRLSRIEVWSEKQGLELAAECHLGRIIQVCRMIVKCSDIQMNRINLGKENLGLYTIHTVDGLNCPLVDLKLQLLFMSMAVRGQQKVSYKYSDYAYHFCEVLTRCNIKS